MRRTILSLVLTVLGAAAAAFEIEDRAVFGDATSPEVLRIVSSADIAFFEPMILAYRDQNPQVTIDYTVASSAEVMNAISGSDHVFDIAISSAMDLQTKLANDGLALAHTSAAAGRLPDWAKWNDMVFAFTQEPAAVVVSNDHFRNLTMPENRSELISVLRQSPDAFAGRVGTYDVRQSGLGYLFATQDARVSETYWRLTEVLGALDAKLFCCSSDMIDAVVSGELAVAYNVLGSYAANRSDSDAFTIVYPSDFTAIMLRTILIPTTSERPDLAKDFVDFVLDSSYRPDGAPILAVPELEPNVDATVNRIRMGPALLVYLDTFKKRSFLAEWENAILQ